MPSIAAAVPWSAKLYIRRIIETGTNWASVGLLAGLIAVDIIAAALLMTGWPGGVWTWLKSSEWFARRRRESVRRALQVLETAVDQTYRCYVQAIKEARGDGRLTSAERVKARMMARERALADQGIAEAAVAALVGGGMPLTHLPAWPEER